MKHGLFAELKRRHVYRVAVAYAVVGWLLIQLASTVFPYFQVPDWSVRLLVLLVVVGFPVALVLAWAFEMTPEGMRRTEPADSPEAREPEQHRKVGHTLDRVIISVLALALVLSVWRPWRSFETTALPSHAATSASSASAMPAKSIAVLPFENLSSDKSNDYFSAGIQDLILTKLADIGDLAVISRTSTMKYGSHPENLQTVGKQLGVATILEGSVQKSGNQVLINVQLIDARNDHHIWANSYTRTLKNVFSVEGEVATKIASALNARLSPAESRRLATTLSDDTGANDLYFRGEYFAKRAVINHDTASMKQAIAFYRQAIARAPDFAKAHARLSILESQLAWFGGGGGNAASLNADALVQAELALKLAPDLADTHLALGYSDYYGKADFAAALKAFSAALALRPNDSNALQAKAYILRRQGKLGDAIDALKQAQALDPRNTNPPSELGQTYMMARRYPEAEQAFQRALALDPNNITSKLYYALEMIYRSGDVDRALDEVQGNVPLLKLIRVNLLIYARRYPDALALLQSIPDTKDTFSAGSIGPKSLKLAVLYQLDGDAARARTFYVRALPETRAQYAALKGSPEAIQAMALIHIVRAELGLGRTSAGLADNARVQAIAEHGYDHMYGPWLTLMCAENYAYAGRPDRTVPLLAQLLGNPNGGLIYSPIMLWIDPAWDPIRKTPAFQALLKKYATYRPANLSMNAGG